jgi:hypothetical protein
VGELVVLELESGVGFNPKLGVHLGVYTVGCPSNMGMLKFPCVSYDYRDAGFGNGASGCSSTGPWRLIDGRHTDTSTSHADVQIFIVWSSGAQPHQYWSVCSQFAVTLCASPSGPSKLCGYLLGRKIPVEYWEY